jgi:hypothetical protein
MWRIWLAPNNASKWQMGLNWAFKELIRNLIIFKLLQLRAESGGKEFTPPSYLQNLEFDFHITKNLEFFSGWLKKRRQFS